MALPSGLSCKECDLCVQWNVIQQKKKKKKGGPDEPWKHCHARPVPITLRFNNHHHRALWQSLAEHSVPPGTTGSLELDASFFWKAKLLSFSLPIKIELWCVFVEWLDLYVLMWNNLQDLPSEKTQDAIEQATNFAHRLGRGGDAGRVYTHACLYMAQSGRLLLLLRLHLAQQSPLRSGSLRIGLFLEPRSPPSKQSPRTSSALGDWGNDVLSRVQKTQLQHGHLPLGASSQEASLQNAGHPLSH